MHERRLQIDAQHHPEPDQRRIFADDGCQQRLGNRGQQRHDDEDDLEEIEKERDEEHEQVDEDQEAPHATGQITQQVFKPAPAIDALEHDGKARRPDQDENHHGREAHGGFVCSDEQLAQLGYCRSAHAEVGHCDVQNGDRHLEGHGFERPDADDCRDPRCNQPDQENALAGSAKLRVTEGGQHDGADGAHRTTFGRCGQAHQQGAEHQENQHGSRDDAPKALLPQRPPAQRQLVDRDGRHPVRLDHTDREGEQAEKAHLHQRGSPGTEVHVADRTAELIGQHHQHQGRRHQLGDGARCRQHAGGVTHVVFVAHHYRQ